MFNATHSIKDELLAYMAQHPVISTHSHHLTDDFFQDFTLDRLLRQSYVNWCGATFDTTLDSRRAYLDLVRFKSYFVWLQKSLQALYGLTTPITAENWEDVSARIMSAHRDSSHHLQILDKTCHYTGIVLDTYWLPGSDNGHPEAFSPTFRIDPLLYGYSKDAKDHDGNSPSHLYGDLPDNLTDYVSWVRELILQKKVQGCVALKSAAAYDRGLDFHNVPQEKAERVFLNKASTPAKEDIRNFQDYLFHRICEIAAECALPLQCHTGLGQLSGTRAMAMKEVIEKHPLTKFVLFHCSFPWTDDISGLLHVYPNVYPDLCWLPILSPTAAQRTLHELIEIGTSDKVCWGCDTWTSEESHGALLAFRYVLAEVLTAKITDGYFSVDNARTVADNIMVHNASRLYNIQLVTH